jgi:para-nitrobenzyl esterase
MEKRAGLTRRSFVRLSGGAAAALGLALAGCGTQQAPQKDEGQKAAPSSGTTIDTAYGPVKGTEEGSVRIWYGIPYAKAPEKDLRWQAPEEPASWSEELDCTSPADPAIQFSNNEVTGTEDCLNLDIYATEGTQKQPVLVYVHGGNNQTGTSQEIPGVDLAANDGCVYVSLSYRLGLFGFMCLPVFGQDTGNFAMLDIAAALDWIRSNIEAFGGDPGNVTVSGFSAGGRDVMAMLASPLFAGKFDKAIAYSGGMTTAEIGPSQKKEALALAPLAVEDGRAATEEEAYRWLLTDDVEVATWLRGVSAERLAPLMGNAGIRMSVFPHLFEDDIVLPKGGFGNADYNAVPLLMLTGTTEFSMFSAFDPFWKSDPLTAWSEDEQAAAKAFAIRYGSDMYRIFNAECSAEAMEARYGKDIYVCQVAFGGETSAVRIDTFGSFHGIFVPMLSSKNNYTSLVPDTFDKEGYQAMGKAFNAYLKNFLETGNPNGEGLATWDAWDSERKESMVFDATETDAVIGMADAHTSYDEILAAMDADTTVPDALKKLVATNDMAGRWFSAANDAHYGAPDFWDIPYTD